MQILWNKEIEEINNSGYLKKDLSITDALVEKFYNEILKNEEKALLDLVFKENIEQKDLDELLKIWDIEVKGAERSLLLAYFVKLHPELTFSQYEEPRLKGLLQNFRFKNLKIISHFSKIGKFLNKSNITPLIIKGGAMKFLRQDLPRVMGDIDIVVPQNVWLKSAKIACELGYEYFKQDVHAIDLYINGTKESVLDIHKFIYFETGKEICWLNDLYARAKKKNIFGVQALLPCNEDLFFITLTNLAKNLRNNTSKAGILYSLFDCKFLIENKRDFNWNIILENATKTGTQVQINFAMKFINKVSSNILPFKVQRNMFFEKEMKEYSNMVMFNRFYLEEIRNKCRLMKIMDVLRMPRCWKSYVFLKTKYQVLKMLKKHPLLIEIFIKDLREKVK